MPGTQFARRPLPAERQTVETTPRSSWRPFILIALVVTVALASSATPTPLYVDY